MKTAENLWLEDRNNRRGIETAERLIVQCVREV